MSKLIGKSLERANSVYPAASAPTSSSSSSSLIRSPDPLLILTECPGTPQRAALLPLGHGDPGGEVPAEPAPRRRDPPDHPGAALLGKPAAPLVGVLVDEPVPSPIGDSLGHLPHVVALVAALRH